MEVENAGGVLQGLGEHGRFTIFLKLLLPLFAAVQHMALGSDPPITPCEHSQRKLDCKVLRCRGLYGEFSM